MGNQSNSIENRIINLLKVQNKEGIEILDWDNFLAGLNSITFIELIVEIEKEFNIEIPDEYLDYNISNSIGKLSSIIKECLQ